MAEKNYTILRDSTYIAATAGAILSSCVGVPAHMLAETVLPLEPIAPIAGKIILGHSVTIAAVHLCLLTSAICCGQSYRS